MCLRFAYVGPSTYLENLIIKPKRSLFMQSRDAYQSLASIDADGFDIGRYCVREVPGVHRNILSAWNDVNLQITAGSEKFFLLLPTQGMADD